MKQHKSVFAHLLQTLDLIAQNTSYPEQFNNERCLADPDTYLKLCEYVFPELENYIIQIEQENVPPEEKLNLLLDLLSDALRIDLSKVDGAQIIRYNFSHIQRLIVVLYEYSKILQKTSVHDGKVKSDKDSNQQIEEMKKPNSARCKYSQQVKGQRKHEKQTHYFDQPYRKKQNHPINYDELEDDLHRKQPSQDQHVHFADKDEYLMPQEEQSDQNRKNKKTKNNRKNRNTKAERENLHSCVVNTLLKEKTRMLEAGVREVRKNKMEDVELEKEGYKTYLKRYTKQNKADRRRGEYLEYQSKKAVKPLKQELPQQDFDKIDNFFQSFAYKFRDQKAAYLRKITALIRKQEVDRFCYHNRIERETKKYMEDRLQQELEAARHQHRVKSAVTRESAQNLEAQVATMKKEEKRMATEKRKELREAKKKQLMQIENVLRQDNERVLMGLEEGGRLEGIIMKMYKRF